MRSESYFVVNVRRALWSRSAVMNRLVYPSLCVALIACGNDEKCQTARNTAAREINEFVDFDVESARLAAETAEMHLLQLKRVPEQLDAELKLVEQSMGCLVKTDCCKRLGAFDNTAKTTIWSIAAEAQKIDLPDKMFLAPEISQVLAPLWTELDRAGQLITATPKEAETWCNAVRENIARVRKDAPPAWQAMFDAEAKTVEAAKQVGAAAKRRVDAVHDWSGAVKKNEKATIAPDLGSGSYDFRQTRDAVVAFNAACH